MNYHDDSGRSDCELTLERKSRKGNKDRNTNIGTRTRATAGRASAHKSTGRGRVRKLSVNHLIMSWGPERVDV